MDTTRCSHRTSRVRHLNRPRRGEGTPSMAHPLRERAIPSSRPAGESDPPCPCGRPALVIFTTADFGDVTWCGA